MRLIDADELRKNVLKWMPSDPCGKEEKEFPFETDICASMVMEIDDAPTVQPDTTTHGSNVVKKGGNDEDRTSGDCISRAQAIDALRAMQTYKLFAGDDMLLIDQAEAQTELMMLPSVQPERPKGRWIPTASEKGRHECSRCHEYAPCYQDGSEHLTTFCVLCGAKMERGEEE